MRIWTWQHSGPAEPELEGMYLDMEKRRVVWDANDDSWHRDERGHWHRNLENDEGMGDLPWSVLLEQYGPLRNRPLQEAPAP